MQILLFLLLIFVAETHAERPGYATVLLYHRFDEPRHPSKNVSQEMFRQQLEYLRQENYRVLSMDQFRSLLASDKIGSDYDRRPVSLDLPSRLFLAQRIRLSL